MIDIVFIKGLGPCPAVQARDVVPGLILVHGLHKTSTVLSKESRRDIHLTLQGNNGIITTERYRQDTLVPIATKD